MIHPIATTSSTGLPTTTRPWNVPPAVAERSGDPLVMQSLSFEFLRKHRDWQPLADLAGFAEHYARTDPVASLVKLRAFGELLTNWGYGSLQLPRPPRATFNDLLGNAPFQAVTPRVVLAKLHALRKEGNRAAHGESVDGPTALWLLREAFDLACWLHLTYGGGAKSDLPSYAEPAAGAGDDLSRADRRAILERLAAQEAQMQKLLEGLEASCSQARPAARPESELQAVQPQALAAAAEAADALNFDEATTRRVLINALLAAAGWRVGTGGADAGAVRQELPVSHQPTPSGEGAADYALFGEDDSGLPQEKWSRS